MYCRCFARLLVALGCAALLLLAWQTAADALPPDTFAGPCSAWTPVNDGAFGMGTGGDSNYNNEEGFEVVVFNEQLYVGMEADNLYGARLWRTRAGVRVPTGQADWEEVAAVDGLPFGNTPVIQNDHIDSLAVFQGALYASTANGGTSTYGTLVYSSATGDANSWTPVIPAGFGDAQNTNFKDMQVFQGWLCGGTQNRQTGAQVWCTQDGATWRQKNYGGFGATANDPPVVEVWSGHVYTAPPGSGALDSGALYFGAETRVVVCAGACVTVSNGALYRTFDLTAAPPTWTRVFTGVTRSRRVDILGDLAGYLYIATAKTGSGIVIYRSASGDPGAWTQVNQDGMNGNSANSGAVVDGAAIHNGALYVAVSNLNTGVEVWRTTGALQPNGLVDWEPVGAPGLGDPHNIYSELLPFAGSPAPGGYLYAWTSNYVTGQRVYRAACPICQTRAITETGRFDFAGVGAGITVTGGLPELTAALPETLTVCARPGAPPTAQPAARPLARAYHITASPGLAALVADLTLTYTPEELAASAVATATTLYLARWTGAAWETCPAGDRANDLAARAVTCRNVTGFSTWAIAGEGAAPTRARARRYTAPPPILAALGALVALAGLLALRPAARPRA